MDFSRELTRIKAQLARAIEGRETSEDRLDPTAKVGRKAVLALGRVPVNTEEGMFDFKFVIHADCPCNAIQKFLDTVTIRNITFATGPKGGKVLGIDGEILDKFYAYYKT